MKRSKAQLNAISRSYREKNRLNPKPKKVVLSQQEKKELQKKDIKKYGSKAKVQKHYNTVYSNAKKKHADLSKQSDKDLTVLIDYDKSNYPGFDMPKDDKYKQLKEKLDKSSKKRNEAYMKVVEAEKPTTWWGRNFIKKR